ncbi:MAG: hypothetical protein ACYTFW_08085 [Planctomycetota bacterium]
MIAKKALIVLALLGIFSGFAQANKKYEVVKIWPEVPVGWHFYGPLGVVVDKAGNVYIGDAGNHRIKKFDSNGRLLTQWGSAGEGQGQFETITSLKVDESGIVYVVDWDNFVQPTRSRIQKFTSYGKFIETWVRKGPDVEQFELAADVAVSSAGNIFVVAVDLSPNRRGARAARIEKFTPDGKLMTHWGSIGDGDGQFVHPISITVDKDGNVYVTDRRKPGVQKFDPNGKFLAKWEGWGETDGLFNLPTSTAFDKEGNMYVLDRYFIQKLSADGECMAKWSMKREGEGNYHILWQIAVDDSGGVYVTERSRHKVLKFDTEGNLIEAWGSAAGGEGQFSSPGSIAVDASGSLFVADVRNSRIQKFNSEGRFLSQWGSRYWFMIGGMTADASGNLYIIGFGSYEVQKFNADGKLITRWGSEGSGDGQFQYMGGIAVGLSGNVYVADTDNCRIQKFSSDGKFLGKWGTSGTGDGQLNCPEFIVVDNRGNVWVSDEVAPRKIRIQEFDADGEFLREFVPNSIEKLKAIDSSGNAYYISEAAIEKYDRNSKLIATFHIQGSGGETLGDISAMCVDASGYMYVAESNKRAIKKYDPAGKLVKEWSPETIEGLDDLPPGALLLTVDGTGNVYVSQWGGVAIWKLPSEGKAAIKFQMEPPQREGRFQNPGGLAVNASGKIYAVDSADIIWGSPSIQKFESDGRFIAIWEEPETAKGVFKCPVSVAVDASGNTYVTDKGNHLVHKFNAKGEFIKSWGSRGTDNGQFNLPEGITVDKTGNVYVCDRQNCRIQKFDPNGKFLTKWGKEGSGDGEFHFPAAVAVDKDGNVFVADSDNHRVQKFTAEGEFLTEWGKFGEAPGQFNVPLGIAVDASGNVYVSDSHNHRIQKFAPVRSP